MKKLDLWLIIDWLPVHSWKTKKIELPDDEYMRLTKLRGWTFHFHCPREEMCNTAVFFYTCLNESF